MKTKYSLLFLLSLLIFTIVACNDDDDNNSEESGFKIIKTSIEQNPAKLEGTIELSSADFEYTVRNDWCEVVKEGNTLKLSAGGNFEITNRSTEIVITSGKKQYNVPVIQIGTTLEFLDQREPNSVNFTLSFAGGSRYVTVLSNVDFEILVDEQGKGWIEVEPKGEGIYEIIVSKAIERREGNVQFKYFDKTLNVNLVQKNFMSYDDFLNATSAEMTYTTFVQEIKLVEGEIKIDTLEKRVTREVRFESKVLEKELYLVGTLESGIERKIPVQYHGDKDGEIRFFPVILDENFTDSQKNPKIVALSAVFAVKQEHSSTGEPLEMHYSYPKKSNPYSASYYPAVFRYLSDESDDAFYKFEHSSAGVPDASLRKRTTRGLQIYGTNATGTIKYGIPYDTIYEMEIVITR